MSERTIAADQLYWALLEPPAVRSSARQQALGYLLESQIPLALEEVVVATAPARGGRVLACALEKRDLSQFEDALSLTPQSIPAAFEESGVEPAALELLCGERTPKAIRTHQRLRVGMVACALIAAAGCLILRAERKRGEALAIASAQRARAGEILERQLGYALGPGRTPGALQAAGELRALVATRGQEAAAVAARPTAVAPFVALLERWPMEISVEAESIQITPSTITVRGECESAPDVQRLAAALSEAFVGFRAEIPAVRVGDRSASFTLQWAKPAGTPR